MKDTIFLYFLKRYLKRRNFIKPIDNQLYEFYKLQLQSIITKEILHQWYDNSSQLPGQVAGGIEKLSSDCAAKFLDSWFTHITKNEVANNEK